MGKFMATLLILVPFTGGAAFAQAVAVPDAETCADFTVMEPDEQDQVIEATLAAAPAAQPPSADAASSAELTEAVAAICTASGDLPIAEAIEQAMAN